MKFSKVVSIQSIRQTVLVCICALAIYGCSGSSNSGSGEIENSGESTAVTANDNSGTANDGSNTTEMDEVSESPVAVEENESTESGEPPVIAQPTPVVTEPSSPATIRVDFDITVPAYMSDELQVRLTWGDINTTAAWVRDENWVASESFPANTENTLLMTYADRNGDITLGSFESTFRTGSGASENFQITANQFDTERWDSDGDGVSNLDELIAGSNPGGDDIPQPVQASLELLPIKTLRITWQTTPNASHYQVFENLDGVSGFSDISGQLDASTVSFDHRVALYARVNAQYLVQSCNDQGCVDSEPVFVAGTLASAIGYFKASNTDQSDEFGASVSLSADGSTLAVGAGREDSGATGINGNEGDNSGDDSGAVYVFVRNGETWKQQAYIKASNADQRDDFGASVSLSADGNTLAVGASREDSGTAGINGDEDDNSAVDSGAVYVFVRNAETWQQQAYVKASNTGEFDGFGRDVSLSADGSTLAVGASSEDSGAAGINGDEGDNSIASSGAVYVFVRNAETWQQQAYVKASNTGQSDRFGRNVGLSADGDTLAVGAESEDSAATGINGDQNDNSAVDSGAVYVFFRSGEIWQQQAYIKASNTNQRDEFGSTVSLSADGNTLAVGAGREDGGPTGETDNSTAESGAVYVFVRNAGTWQQQAYVKASNPDREDNFGGTLTGGSISLSADGNTLVVAAVREDSGATGINGDEGDNSATESGAVYVFVRNGEIWQQQAYVKSNTANRDGFGRDVSLSADGNTLAISAPNEDSAATGVNGDQADISGISSGAVYLY